MHWIRKLRSSALVPSGGAWLYALFAGTCVLIAALGFVHSLKWQLFLSQARGGALDPNQWSAPLDDVFIHFDFARSAARGAPFEWSEGNGYSSGGTSLLYPLTLALGYWLGFTGSTLMYWAMLLAATAVFGMLLTGRRAFAELPSGCVWLLPPVLLSIGALNWSLFSGMEVALFLGLWGVCLVAWDDVFRCQEFHGDTPGARYAAATVLGLACALLVGTRPEAVPAVAAFSVSASVHVWRRHGASSALIILLVSALPGALVIVGQAIANRVFTGDFSAAGALTKLEFHDPLLSAEEVWQKWKYHFGYQVARVTEHHMGRVEWSGALLWALAVVPLADSRTRRFAALIWVQALLWIATVGLNGQVIWQNERYTMPAAAWLLVNVALGAGVILRVATSRDFASFTRLTWARWGGRVALLGGLAALLSVYVQHQIPRYRDQLWFFGRASRNIADQHVRTARIINALIPKPRRVLVGDAGAIPYESDVPAFDIIGLGGYHDLPVAKAQRWGVAATLELIQRLPRLERPDLLAIYPSWWGSFPLWFGEPLLGVPVRGNVICGGHTKMLYRPNWRPLDDHLPLGAEGERATLIDALDVADLVDEQRHHYQLEGDVGFVGMKLLTLPDAEHEVRRGRDTAARAGSVQAAIAGHGGGVPASRGERGGDTGIWDAGRLLKAGAHLSFRLTGFSGDAPVRLVFRTAAPRPSSWRIEINGQTAGKLELNASDHWQHTQLKLPNQGVSATLDVLLESESGENFLYHVWGVEVGGNQAP